VVTLGTVSLEYISLTRTPGKVPAAVLEVFFFCEYRVSHVLWLRRGISAVSWGGSFWNRLVKRRGAAVATRTEHRSAHGPYEFDKASSDWPWRRWRRAALWTHKYFARHLFNRGNKSCPFEGGAKPPGPQTRHRKALSTNSNSSNIPNLIAKNIEKSDYEVEISWSGNNIIYFLINMPFFPIPFNLTWLNLEHNFRPSLT